MDTIKTMGDLTQGTIINFNRCITADFTNYVVLRQYEDRFGKFTEVLNLTTHENDSYTQHTKIENLWSIYDLTQINYYSYIYTKQN